MHYTKEITVRGSEEKVFDAINCSLSLWWGKTSNPVLKVGNEFKTSFGKAYWKFRVTEYKPYKRIVWECIDGQPEFEHEWVGTTIRWDIKSQGDGTLLSFTHVGLTPDFDCYNVCAPTWDHFLANSLTQFVETGKGLPH
ncbi:MAG: SRPBCC domain-containing protein [Cyclobacteriaceae bacterium]